MAKNEELTRETAIIKKWIRDPLAWVEDIFGDNIRIECKKLTGVEIRTRTGLTVQQEQGLVEVGNIIRAKLLTHLGAKLTEPLKTYAGKIGVSIQSGQGAGKDFFLAIVMMYFMHVFEDARVVATANTAKQLRNVLWAEISKVMSLARKVNSESNQTILQYLFEWQAERIFLKEKRGERWFAEAVTINTKASEKEQGEALAGRHEKYMLIGADEACGIPDAVFKPLEGTLTGVVNLLVLIFNPTKTTGFAIESQRDARFVALRWNSEESEIVNKAHVESMALKYGKDSNTYRIRVLGLPPLADTDSLIPWEWIEDARNRELTPLEEDFLVKACDFGAGGDKSVICTRKGGKVYKFKTSTTKDSNTLTDWVYSDFVRDEADILLGDSVGIGWAVMGNLRKQIGGHKVRSIDSRGKPYDDKRFFNKRAEMFWNLRTAFENKEISLPPDESNELINQLGAIKYTDESGKIKIIKKASIKEEIGHSPDEADALAISYALPMSLRKQVKNSEDKEDRPMKVKYTRGWMSA